LLHRKSIWRAWLPAVLWLLVIAAESTPVFSSAHTAVWLRPFVALFGTGALYSLYFINAVLRKTGHFIGYAVLSWFAYRGWRETLAVQQEVGYEHRNRRPTPRCLRETLRMGWNQRAALLALLSTTLVAALDEWHQSLLPNRTGAVHDVVLDSLGGLFAQSLVMFAAMTFARPDAPRPVHEEVTRS